MFGLRLLLVPCLVLSGLGMPCARAAMVVVRELLYHPAAEQPEYLVLENLTASPLDIADWRVTEGVHFDFPPFATNQPMAAFLKAHERILLSSHAEADVRRAYEVPASYRLFGPWTGKLANEGERITVADKNGVVVCSVKYDVCDPWPAAAAGRSLVLLRPSQRLDDPRNWTLSAQVPPRPGARPGEPVATALESPRAPGVIINEIMFDPPSGWAGSEYVELFNCADRTIDVSGWKFCDGIEFVFPVGTTIPAQGFLVVARDAARMRQASGDLPVVGDFAGRLRSDGETIRLVDPRGATVAALRYGTGGDWPELTQGGGSSLELLHPSMDGRLPSAWAASDESHKTSPRRYSTRGTYREIEPLGDPGDHRELRLYLTGSGHLALTNVTLVAGGTNLLAPGDVVSTNGSAAGGWLCQGTHAGSFMSNGQFHVVADGRGDDRANRVEIDAPGLQPGQSCELNFEARWIAGSARLIAETWDGSLSHSFRLDVPQALGTPGRPNSRALAAPPPQVDELRHHPAIPRSTEVVRITARVVSSGPLREVQLFHRPDRVDGTGPWRTTSMTEEDGGQGVFSAVLPEDRTNGAVVQFYVRAVARDGQRAALPRAGAEGPALFVVDDRARLPDLREVRLVVSARDLDALTNGHTPRHGFRFPRLSGHYFDATAILGDNEIIYGAKVRQTGSPLTRDESVQKLKLKLPASRPFRGRTKFAYDDDAAEGRAYHNRVVRYLLYRLGAPANENEFVRLTVNAAPPVVREEVEPVDNEFLDRHFADGRRGDLYRIDDEWRCVDDWEGLNREAEWTGSDAREPGALRRAWRKRTREAEDDDARLRGLFKAVASSNSPPEVVNEFLDAAATLKVAAVRGYIGDWDSFTMQRGHNGFLYRPPGVGRFQLLHWDSDEGFITGQPFYGEGVRTWLEQPRNQRLFFGYLLELMEACSREPARLVAWLAAERQAVGSSVFQASYLNFFKAREAEVREALAGKDRIPFTVEAAVAGLNASNAAPVRLSGRAPYGVFAVEVARHPEAVIRWVTDVDWTSEIRSQPMEDAWTVQGLDRGGAVRHEERTTEFTAKNTKSAKRRTLSIESPTRSFHLRGEGK